MPRTLADLDWEILKVARAQAKKHRENWRGDGAPLTMSTWSVAAIHSPEPDRSRDPRYTETHMATLTTPSGIAVLIWSSGAITIDTHGEGGP